MVQRIVFIINASRKLSAVAREVIARAETNAQLECESHRTAYPKHAIELAYSIAQQGDRTIVAVGGDGTCHEVINGIIRANNPTIRFAILPNGTGNDFHRMLGKFDTNLFLRSLEYGNAEPIDVIKVIREGNTEFALNISGAGFDGFVVRMLDQQRSKWKLHGKPSYAVAIVRAFLRYRKATVTIKANDFDYKGKALMVVACNGAAFGHGLVIHPNADIRSGTMGVTLLGNVSLMDYVRHLKDLKKGKEIIHPEVHYFSCTSMEIKANKSMFIEADGELLGLCPVTYSIVPSAIKLLQSV